MFTTQMTPLFFRSDVENELQACFSSKQAFLRSVATKHTDLKVLALRDKSEGTVYKVRNAKQVLLIKYSIISQQDRC